MRRLSAQDFQELFQLSFIEPPFPFGFFEQIALFPGESMTRIALGVFLFDTPVVDSANQLEASIAGVLTTLVPGETINDDLLLDGFGS